MEDGLEGADSEDAAGVDAVLLLDSAGFAVSFDSAGLLSPEDSEDDSELLGA